jgi:hypothetical protein
VIVELLEQHEQQQRDDHPDGGFGKHIIHENSSDAHASFTEYRTTILPAISGGRHARPSSLPKKPLKIICTSAHLPPK